MEFREKKEAVSAEADKQAKARFEEVLMKEAYANIEKGEYETAARIFEDIERRFGAAMDDAQKSLAYSELALLHYWLGGYAAARHFCEKSLAYGDRNDQAYNILGKICVAEFKFAEARANFSKISSGNPAKPLGHSFVSIKLRERKEAERHLREAEGQTSSNDLEYRVYHTYIQLLRGDADLALQEARAVKQKCKRDPMLVLLIAEIFMSAGNYGEAVSTARQVQPSIPENDQVYAILAHAAYAEEDLGAAGNNAEQAVRLNPRNGYAKTVLMKLATRNGDYGRAETLGLQILADSPEYSLGHANLGDVYFNQGRYEVAQVEYEHCKDMMDAATKGARLRKARMKFMDGSYAEAVEILEELILKYHTYYDDAMCDLALCYDALGDEEKKAEIIDKMQMRRSFYHRTEKLLQDL